MCKDLIGEKVTLMISSRGDNVLEFDGTLINETDDSVELANVDISIMMLNFQKGIFGSNMNKYRENVNKVFINKRYIISINKG